MSGKKEQFFGSNLKHLRGQAKLTVLDLSLELKSITPAALSSYEDRNIMPRMDGLLTILDHFNDKYSAALTLDMLVQTDLAADGFKLPKPVYHNAQSSENPHETLSKEIGYLKEKIFDLEKALERREDEIINLNNHLQTTNHSLNTLISKLPDNSK